MRRLVVVLGVILAFNSCDKNERLSGLWIGSYQLDVKTGKPIEGPFPIRMLIQVKGNQVIIKSLGLSGKAFSDDKFVANYNDNIISGFGPFKIESLQGDSLILEADGDKIVFKKFEQSSSPSFVKLTGNIFAFANNYGDSIDFVNDSLYFNLNRRESYDVADSWFVKEFGGHKFLILGQFSPLFFIESVKNDSVFLKNFGAGRKQITLVKLKERKVSFNGSWEEVYRIYDDPDLPPPPLTKIKIIFDADSVEIMRGGHGKKRRWKLNSTSEILFFPDQIFKGDNWAWRVIHNRGDSLVVDRRILNHDSFLPKETVVFRRVQ